MLASKKATFTFLGGVSAPLWIFLVSSILHHDGVEIEGAAVDYLIILTSALCLFGILTTQARTRSKIVAALVVAAAIGGLALSGVLKMGVAWIPVLSCLTALTGIFMGRIPRKRQILLGAVGVLFIFAELLVIALFLLGLEGFSGIH